MRAISYNHNKEYESALSEARVQLGLTVNEFCEKVEMSTNMYSGLNSGIIAPILRSGEVKPIAKRISNFLNMELYDIWPSYFCPISKYNLSDNEIVESFHSGLISTYFADPEIKMIERNKIVELESILRKFSKKEASIFVDRFVYDLTLNEIGKKHNVSRQAIELQAKNIFKTFLLRVRDSEVLRDYIDD